MKSILLLALPALAVAQIYGPPPGPATTSATTSAPLVVPSAPANTPGHINVDVGPNGTFSYNPNNFNASVGTLVTFWFPSGIPHSVTQSSFANPCTRLAASGNSPGGFDSGLQTAVNFTINITDTNPIYFHCKQVTHCGGSGMVGAINAPASGNGSFASLMSAAMALGPSFQSDSDNGFVSGGGVDGIPTGSPVADSVAATGSSGSSGSGAIQIGFSAGLLALSALSGLTLL